MSLSRAIDAGTIKHTKRDRRKYVGASNIGHKCHAYLQYSLRGYPQKSIPGGVLRIFELGHVIEEIVVQDLKNGGCRVAEVDPETLEQWEVTAIGDHLRGHADGIIATDMNNLSHVEVLEIKSMNDKKWNAFKTQGIYNSHPLYYAQMQLLMGLLVLNSAQLVAYNKNNSAYHSEQVDFDEDYFDMLMDKAIAVIHGQSARRISNNPLTFECRYCNFRPHCWPNGEEPLDTPVECHTCTHAKPVANRHWICKKHGTRTLLHACDDWQKVESTPAND